MKALYVIDASSWINLKNAYPEEIFPSIWFKIDNLISEKQVLSPRIVQDEIDHGNDKLIEWVKTHSHIFVNTDNLIPQVQKILREHPTLIKPDAKYEEADPYVIALAASHKNDIASLSPIIVTEENQERTSGIPYAARDNGIPSCKLLEMIQREGWTF